jgi:hypothetical protein
MVESALASGAPISDSSRRLAREEILIAEGSDWFWWFGDENSSGHDDEWDALFRSHLSNACAAAGLATPGFLRKKIARERTAPGSEPLSRLAVKVDGRAGFFEWVDAGRLPVRAAGGATARAEASRLTEIRYGFALGDAALCLRIDACAGPASILAPPCDVALVISAPIETRIVIGTGAGGRPVASDSRVAVAADRTIELKVPLAAIGSPTPGDEVLFRVEIREAGLVVESVPVLEDVALRLDSGGRPERSLWP